MTAYNTHHSKNHEKARKKLPLTPIIPKVAECYSHPALCIHIIFMMLKRASTCTGKSVQEDKFEKLQRLTSLKLKPLYANEPGQCFGVGL